MLGAERSSKEGKHLQTTYPATAYPADTDPLDELGCFCKQRALRPALRTKAAASSTNAYDREHSNGSM